MLRSEAANALANIKTNAIKKLGNVTRKAEKILPLKKEKKKANIEPRGINEKYLNIGYYKRYAAGMRILYFFSISLRNELNSIVKSKGKF